MTTSTAGEGEYMPFHAGGKMAGGTMPPQDGARANHWYVYFAVADADSMAAKAAELGGSVLAAPFDTSVDRVAALRDPQGATFSIIKPAPQPA